GPTEVAHLPGLYHAGQRVEGLLQRSGPVVDVDVEQVDAVGTHAAQALVDRPADRLPAGTLEPHAAPVRPAVRAERRFGHHPADLGGQEHLVAPAGTGEPPAQQRLALVAAGVGPG